MSHPRQLTPSLRAPSEEPTRHRARSRLSPAPELPDNGLLQAVRSSARNAGVILRFQPHGGLDDYSRRVCGHGGGRYFATPPKHVQEEEAYLELSNTA